MHKRNERLVVVVVVGCVCVCVWQTIVNKRKLACELVQTEL